MKLINIIKDEDKNNIISLLNSFLVNNITIYKLKNFSFIQKLNAYIFINDYNKMIRLH